MAHRIDIRHSLFYRVHLRFQRGAVLRRFPPNPRQRRNDRRFVGSEGVHPLQLFHEVVRIEGPCTQANASAQLQERLARQGITLLKVMSVRDE